MFSFKYHRSYDKERVEKKHLDRALFFRLLTYLRPHRKSFFGALFLLVLARFIDAFVPLLLGYFVRAIFQNSSFEVIRNGVGFVTLLLFLSYFLEAGHVLLRSRLGQEAIFSLRKDVFHHILSLPAKYFENNPVGRIMTRAVHDVDQVNQMFTESLVPIFGSLVLFSAIALFMLVASPLLFTVFFLIFPLVLLLTVYFRRFQRVCYDRIRSIISAMNSFVQEHLAGVFVIQRFSLEEREKEKFQEINEDHCTAYQESIYHFSFFLAGLDFFQSLMIISLFAILQTEGFDAGSFFTFTLYTLMLFRPMIDLLERFNILQSTLAASERLFSLLDEKSESSGSLKCAAVESVEFRDVWFSYNEGDPVLKGVSFKIKKGEVLGIAGVSGSGKSTLVSLLLGFYTPEKGEILINGKKLSTYYLPTLRKQMSPVLQDPALFEGTLLENATFNQTGNLEKVSSLLENPCFKELYSRFPDGPQHKIRDKGNELSLGEKQLLALSRALFREAPFFVLDEATAHIDMRTETKIEVVLKKTLRNKTAIIIAHRLSTIQFAKKIAVLDEGRVVEEGTADELLRKNGYYASWVKTVESRP